MASEDESKLQGEVGGGDSDASARAKNPDEPDDLASLADGLPSLRPAPGESADGEDDGRLDLARLVGSAAAAIDDKTAAPATDAAALKNLAAAAATASVTPPAGQQRPWLVPMLVGLGLGVGLAGVGFGLSANRAPAPPAATSQSEAVGAAPAAPVPEAQPKVPAGPAPEESAPPSNPSTTTSINAVPENPQAPDRHATTAPRTPRANPSELAATAAPAANTTSPAAPPVLSVKPASAPEQAAAPSGANDPLAEPAANNPHDPRSMDALLDEALAPSAQRQEIAHQRELALHDNELPLTPSRDDVTKAMTVLLPAIRGCAMGQSGLATAGIVVRNDGRVASVEVAGPPFAGTASGRCMEGVMRRAQFPRFKQAIFRIKFPFAIQ